jgi:hypothetical protein
MTASSDGVKSRIGDVYNDLPSTRDTDITEHLANAQAYVNEYTGSQSGTLIDSAVENLAAMYCCVEAAGGNSTGFNFSIGKGSFDFPTEKYKELAEKFKQMAEMELSVAGRKIRYAKTNS